ncbi:unnamed protein product [Mycena citricolor]|uniref:RTA1-domain-containing protein n=1 Tax=Mycena citricolor TaxID=2018698 RepID=A0AAD2K2J8_9AGAR|nr:unnamed protein product [Mycena citricolor]
MPATGLLLLSTLFPIAQVFAAPKGNIPRPADPFLDPKHDVFNPLRYIASNVLTGIAFETGLVYKRGARFMLSMVIGCYTFAIGFGTRFGLHSNPEGKGLYIVEYLFIVLSPCAFIASEYVLLGRLARYLECDRHLMVPARRITKIFVSSDITTFLIQIFLAGLVLQLVSFLVFITVFVVFLYRLYTYDRALWASASSTKQRDWRILVGAMALSFLGILIRSLYRVIELSQGYVGHLATDEALFYALDTLPLFLAIAVYVFVWPGNYIGDGTPPIADQTESTKDTELAETH